VLLRPVLLQQVIDLGAPRGKCVGDEGAVAALRNQLGAHDGGALSPRQLQQLVEGTLELLGKHVVGVVPEAGRAQSRVR